MSLNDLLQHPKAIPILLALAVKPLPITLLQKQVGGSYTTIYTAVKWMKLLNIVEPQRKGKTILYNLTPKGLEIAKTLNLILTKTEK